MLARGAVLSCTWIDDKCQTTLPQRMGSGMFIASLPELQGLGVLDQQMYRAEQRSKSMFGHMRMATKTSSGALTVLQC